MNNQKQIEMEAYEVGRYDGYHAAEERQELPEAYRPGGRLRHGYLEGFRAGVRVYRDRVRDDRRVNVALGRDAR